MSPDEASDWAAELERTGKAAHLFDAERTASRPEEMFGNVPLDELEEMSPEARLRLANEVAVAQAVQLGLEYDPDPPFASGHPDRAFAEVKTMVSPRYEAARANFRNELSRMRAGMI